MNTRLELIQLAHSGDPTAIQTLIERNQAIVYRLACSLLDDPMEAAEATRETFVAALNGLEDYNGKIAFPTWLYYLTVSQCRQHLRRKRLVERLPRRVQALFKHSQRPDRLVESETPADREHMAALFVSRLEDRLRLPLILRYDHDLTVNETAAMLGQKLRAVQSLLVEARARLRAALAIEPLGSLEFADGDARSHQRAQKLVETAGLITDEDALWLEGHLKTCEGCRTFAQRMADFENELRTALRRRWDAQPVPALNFTPAVVDRRRSRTTRRQAVNLIGAGLIGLAAISVIVFLPSIAPPEALRPLVTASPTPAPTVEVVLLPSATPPLATPAPTATEILVYRSTSGPTATPLPNNPELIRKIYPGKLVYVPLRSRTNVLMTMLPDGSDVHLFETGFSDNTYPVWSPDGSRIAFLASSGGVGPNQVVVMDADGSHQHLVSRDDLPAYPTAVPTQAPALYPRLFSYGPPHWSPDGHQLVVSLQFSYAISYLTLLAADGSRAFYLPVDGLDRSLVAWSPDGTTIAYLAKNGVELWVWKPGQPQRPGENPRQIRSDVGWDSAYGISWSPDSNRVALMVGNQDNVKVEVNLRIFQLLTGQSLLIPVSSGILSLPFYLSNNLAWSPDGKYLAYSPVFTDTGKHQVILIRPDDRNWSKRILVDVNWGLNGFTWSPDGRWIAVSAGMQVWGVSLDAFEKSENPLVALAALDVYTLNWQKVN